jgi:hypothetical protein
MKKSTLVFLTVPVGIFAAILFLRAQASPCECGYFVGERPSPDGSWIAEIYRDSCDVYDEKVVFALRRVGETPRQKKNIAASSAGDPDTVVFSWLDKSTVALASFGGSAHSARFFDFDRPAEFRGIKLAYFTYPDRPDAARTPQSRIVESRQIDFAYRFDPSDKSLAYPGVNCAIRMTGADNSEFGNIDVHLYGFKSNPGSGGSYAYVRVILDSSIERPNITAIALDQFNPADRLHRDGRKTQAVWQVSSGDLMREISRLRTRSLNLKIGYFLDNTEIVYSNRNDFDITALDQFERCVADNAVFSPSLNQE